jgi:hypothetical protein
MDQVIPVSELTCNDPLHFFAPETVIPEGFSAKTPLLISMVPAFQRLARSNARTIQQTVPEDEGTPGLKSSSVRRPIQSPASEGCTIYRYAQ